MTIYVIALTEGQLVLHFILNCMNVVVAAEDQFFLQFKIQYYFVVFITKANVDYIRTHYCSSYRRFQVLYNGTL